MNNYHLNDYYINAFKKTYRKRKFNSHNKVEHDNWKKDSKIFLSDAIGLPQMTPCKPEPKILEEVHIDNYTRKKVTINTQPHVAMPFYELIPDSPNGKIVLALHGHGSDGKNLLVGIIDEELNANFERFNYCYAIDLVKRGYKVYVPDLAGSGERRLLKQESNIKASSCSDLNFAAISLGFTLMGLIVWDLMQLINFIDTDEVCSLGFSGGALASLFLAALDSRVKCTVLSGYYHSFLNTLLEHNLCGCNFVPNLYSNLECCDIGAMIAPRKLAIESGTDDPLNNGRFGLDSVIEQVNITKKAYELYDKKENLEHFICEGEHTWFGAAYDFIDRWREESND